MFNFLKKKSEKRIPNDLAQLNPSVLFPMLGETMNALWKDLVSGENRAVDLYANFKRFEEQLRQEYKFDFNRILTTLTTDSFSLDLCVGDLQYLKILGVECDLFLSSEQNIQDSVFLSFDDYERLCEALSFEERSYCLALKEFLNTNLRSLVNSVSVKLVGFEKCRFPLPFNTRQCVDYHRLLADYDFDESVDFADNSSWIHISKAPIMNHHSRINPQNPLIPININNINAYILDWICYATIALPTTNLVRVLYAKPDNSPLSVLQKLKEVFGPEIETYIKKVILDMNFSPFRRFVYSGLKLQ